MLRRHFSGTRDIWTGLSSRIRAESDAVETRVKSTETPPVLEDKRSAKFNSSFSIESLLRKDPEIRSTSTLDTDATEDVNFLRKGCVYSPKEKFGWGIKPTASFGDFPENDIHSYPQCGCLTYHDPYDTKRDVYTPDADKLCKRARLSPPIVVYPTAGISPYFNHEHMFALKRWSLSANTFDSRNFWLSFVSMYNNALRSKLISRSNATTSSSNAWP